MKYPRLLQNKILKLKLFLATFFLFTTAHSAGAIQCRDLFAHAPVITQSDINARIEFLANFLLKIEFNEINSDSKAQAVSHLENDLKKLIEIDPNYLNLFRKAVDEQRIRYILKKAEKEAEDKVKSKERRIVIKSAAQSFRQATFHEIAPGHFKMGFQKEDVEISKPFSMMSTAVTQAMWAHIKLIAGERDINKLNPSYFKTGEEADTIDINGTKIEMKKNHPVEQVSWNDVQEFIVDLNRLSNSPDPGTQQALIEIIPDHKKGDIYDIPYEAQWEFVLRNRGRNTEEYFDSANVEDVSEYAWHQFNSDDQTHEVATRKPRIIDGKAFYDLEGNVYEWMKDLFDHAHLPGGKDPKGVLFSPYRALRGGPYSHDPHDTSANARYGFLPDSPSEEMGFRLVRTRPN